jgi:hypothetical protein
MAVDQSDTVVDIDANDFGDANNCAEYVNDIYDFLSKREVHFRTRHPPFASFPCSFFSVVAFFFSQSRAQLLSRPACTYMESVQRDITPHMRAVLIDWLVEVQAEFQLCSESLFLCTNFIDRFLSLEAVPRARLQLVGVSCLLIATKYEEVRCPRVRECVFICDNTYSGAEVCFLAQLRCVSFL